jgi:hypothetical protein
MPVPVKVYRWSSETDAIPLNEDDWVMYELPVAGDRYWHGSDGFTVREVDEAQDPPHVHLLHDYEWAREVRAQLPEGYSMEGGRASDDRQWHFNAVTPEQGRPLGPVFMDDLDDALNKAIANALEHYRQSQEASG